MNHEAGRSPPGRPGPQAAQPRAGLVAPEAEVPHAQDYWRINLREDWEVTFWRREFECTEQALREAVRAVGDRAGNVRLHLFAEHQQRRN